MASISRVISLIRCSNWRRSANKSASSFLIADVRSFDWSSRTCGQVELEQTRALAQGNPVFQAEGSHLIDQARPRSDHLVSHPVQSLKIGLFFALECSKPHCWSRSCFCDRLRIDDVGFVRFT